MENIQSRWPRFHSVHTVSPWLLFWARQGARFQSGTSLSDFPIKLQQTWLAPSLLSTCAAHITLFYLIVWLKNTNLEAPVSSFSLYYVVSLKSRYYHYIIFEETQHTFLPYDRVRKKALHPHKTTGIFSFPTRIIHPSLGNRKIRCSKLNDSQ
jgi:hypothetical protein